MSQRLVIHPGSRCAAVSRIEVEAARPRQGHLALRYAVTGTIDDLRLPPNSAPERTHGLWRHTCFEAFMRAGAGDGYYELNFAPSRQWAAYRFSEYRAGMSESGEIGTPRIELRSDSATFELHAVLELGRLPDLPVDEPWRLGLSAVIEEKGGGLSYWALAHPRGKPDFHHSDCFACELAPALRP